MLQHKEGHKVSAFHSSKQPHQNHHGYSLEEGGGGWEATSGSQPLQPEPVLTIRNRDQLATQDAALKPPDLSPDG